MFDSHCHLTDERFTGDVDAVLGRARDAGVNGLVTIGGGLDDAVAAAALAEQHDSVWCTAGVHPHAAAEQMPGWTERLRELLAHPRCVAIGEAGLDYFYENSPRAEQRSVFERQLELSAELGLPVVVHSRDAEADTISMIRAAPAARGVLHCFDAGPALLETALEGGWYVSFAGLVTFKRYERGDLVAAVPDDRLLVETDSPYLAPVPHRGKRNEPAFVARVVERVASFRGADLAETGTMTERNARAFYGIGGVS